MLSFVFSAFGGGLSFLGLRNAVAAGIDFDVECLSPSRRMLKLSFVNLFVFVFTPVVYIVVASVAFILSSLTAYATCKNQHIGNH